VGWGVLGGFYMVHVIKPLCLIMLRSLCRNSVSYPALGQGQVNLHCS